MSQSREEWLNLMVDILGVDAEDILEVAAMFYETIDERLHGIATAHENGDLEELTRLVHGLKGDAANIGFKRTSAVARTLENQCRHGEIMDFANQFAALEAAVVEQREAIGLTLDPAPDSNDESSSE